MNNEYDNRIAIKGLIRILKQRGFQKISNLLTHSYGLIDESSTYGSYLYSTISTFEIYSPPELNMQLLNLNENQKKIILESILQIYPPKANSPEIVDVKFIADPLISYNNDEVLSSIKELNFDYLNEQIEKCNSKLVNNDYEGSITNARTMIESILLYIIQTYDNNYVFSGNLLKLAKDTFKRLDIDPQIIQFASFREIATGCISIINGVSNIRNNYSDSHGKGKLYNFTPKERHAKLAIGIAKVFAEFIIDVWKYKVVT